MGVWKWQKIKIQLTGSRLNEKQENTKRRDEEQVEFFVFYILYFLPSQFL